MPCMDARRLEWNDVQLFFTLVREGSLTAAARALGCDTSTVSRRLGALEATLGAALFVRSREGVRPTLAAEELLPEAQAIDEAVTRLTRLAQGLDVAPEGVVRLTVPPSVAETFVVPRLPGLYAKYPKLRLEVQATATVADLTRREADLAIRTVRPTSGDLTCVRLLAAPYAVFGTRAVARRLGRLKHLDGVAFVTWTHDFAMVPSARWLARAAPKADVVLRVSSLGGQLAGAAAGLGLAVLPRQVAVGLVEVELAPALRATLPADELWLVGHQALRHVPRVAVTWEHLRAVARG